MKDLRWLTDKLSENDQEELRKLLKVHLESQHDLSLGRFELDDIVHIVAPFIMAAYYNKGLREAVALVSKKMENVYDDALVFEKLPGDFT